jgi:hypothetical protein
MNTIGKWLSNKSKEPVISAVQDDDILVSDEWYQYYRKCAKNIRKIRSILENFTNQPQGYSKTDRFWDEMVEIGRLADIKDPEEMKEWLLHCKTKGKRIKKQVTPERRKELHSWKKRAKSVGIDLLPSRRPFMGERKEWEESIVKAESIPKYKNKRVDIGEYKRECINALKYLKKGDSFLVEDRIPQTVEWWLIAMKNTMKEFKDKIFHAEEINHNTQRIWRVK